MKLTLRLLLMMVLLPLSIVHAEGFYAVGESAAWELDARNVEASLLSECVVHDGGTLAADETWKSDEIHIVYGTLVVPEDVTLAIEPGAVVKFIGGGLLSLGTCVANDATFTDIEDGSGVAVPSYVLRGNFETGEATKIKFARNGDEFEATNGSVSFDLNCRGELELPDGAVVHSGGTLAADETWKSDEIHIVYGTPVIPEDVTLTIEPGAVVKFTGGGLVSLGACVANGVTFTDIEDGSGVAVPSYVLRGNFETGEATKIKFARNGDEFEATNGSVSFDLNCRGELELPDGAVVHSGGTLAADETWKSDEIHIVYGTLVVPEDVTLTIEPGAVVKFIGGGLVSLGTCVANGVTFTDIEDGSGVAVPSYVLRGNFVTDEATGIKFARNGDEFTANGDSGAFVLDISDEAYRFARTKEEITYSSLWSDGEGVVVTVTDPQGDMSTLVDESGEAKGVIQWIAPTSSGVYCFTHQSGEEVMRFDFIVLEGAIVHSGAILSDEVWSKDVVHVIGGDTYVPVGVTLTIEPGSVVKFAEGKVLSMSAGGTCDASGVLFTSLHDDTAGGDTLADGDTTLPAENSWTILGMVNDDFMTEYRYGTVSLCGAIACDTIWRKDKTYVIDGTLTVESGATLTIPSGTVVKFTDGSSLAVESGGECIARGAIFTHIADDAVGGDTMGDGDATTPEYGKYKVDVNIVEDDATEYRYYVPTTLSATISIDTMLRGNRVYVASNDVTVANGATLTVGHGASIKFISGKSLRLQSGSHLIAKGTRSRPVVFTSIKDDLHGGDTNGDGDRSVAYPGDWGGVISNGGRLDAEYAQFLYGGGVNGNGYGARASCFMWDNASGVFDCCRFFCSPMDGCFAQNATFNNCIFDDNDRGLVSHTGTITANNCVAANNRIGFFSHCSPLVVRNSISSLNTESAITGDGGSRETASCYFGDDPKFLDPENGDYRIAADSPCVDAGDMAYAPEKDYYGSPRYALTYGDEAKPDVGIYEVPPRSATSDIDLVVKSVTTPKTLTVGEYVTISWRESNIGSADAKGKWYDKVELVAANGAVVMLGSVSVTGIVAGGDKTITAASFRVPAVVEGICAIRVTANYQRDIYEGSLTANNVCLSDDATVVVSDINLSEGTGASVNLITGQQVSYKMVGLPTGGSSLLIHSGASALSGAYVAFGKMPTTYVSASSYVVLPNGDMLVSIPPHSAGEAAYMMLDSTGKEQVSSLAVEMSEEYPAIYALSKESMPNTGSQSLTIYGVGLDEVARVALVATDGAGIPGTSLHAASACELSVSFTLTGAKTGAYRVVVVAKDGTQAVSSVMVTVIPNANAKARLEVSLDVPPAIRQNRWYEAVVTVKNTGDADAIVPIVVLSGEGVEFRDPDGGNEIYEGIIHLLALPNGGKDIVLQPNASSNVRCAFRASGDLYELRTRVVNPSDVTWDTLYGLGETEGEKADYANQMDSYFGSVENFVSEVVSLGTRVASTGINPKNAIRLYDTLITNKSGTPTSVISGYLVSSETLLPVSGFTLGFTAGLTNDFVYVTTDASGAFVAYDVPTGIVSVASENGCVKTEGIIELGLNGLYGVRLIKREMPPEASESSELVFGAECNNVRILPFDEDVMCLWLDGYELCSGKRSDAWDKNILLPGVSISSYDVHAISEDECAFVGVAENEEQQQSLVWFKITKAKSDGLLSIVNLLETNVLTTCKSVSIMSADDEHVSVVYSATTNSATALYSAVLPFSGQSKKMQKAAPSPLMKAIGVNSSVAVLLPREITASLGIADISIEIPISDNNNERCCISASSCSGGGKVNFGLKALDIRGSGNYQSESASRCANYFYQGTLGCGGCDELLTWASKTKWSVTGGIGKGLPIPYIHKLKGVDYKSLRNAPFSWDVSGDVGGDLRYSYERILKYAPSSSGPRLETDYCEGSGGYTLHGDVGVSFSLGRPEVLASRGRGRSKQEKSFFSMSTGLINANVTFNLDLKWQDGIFTGAVGSGSLSGSLYNLEVHATLVNDHGDFGWKWGWSIPTEEHEHLMFKSRLGSLGAGLYVRDGNVPLVTPVEVSGNTFSPSSVSKLSNDNGFVFLRQDKRDGVVRTDVMRFDGNANQVEPIVQPDMDIGIAQAMQFDGDKAGVVFVAAEHNLTGTADDAFDALGKTKLYIVRYNGNEWGEIQKIAIPENEYVGKIVVAQNSLGTNLVVYGASIVDGESVSQEIRSVVITSDAVSIPRTVLGGIGSDLVSVDATWNDGIPVVVCSVEGEDYNDAIRCFIFDATGWIEDIQRTRATVTAEVNPKQGRLTSNANVKGLQHNRLTARSCDNSCSCGCQGEKPKQKPKPRCGCPSSCTCKGLCGANCQCGGGGGGGGGETFKSEDPNEIAGPAGVGEERYVKPGELMDYTIYFENKTNATAAAQDVYVVLPKDAGLDWSAFELGEVVFGDNIDTSLSGLYDGESSYAIPGTNWSVRTVVEHTADSVKWHLRIIDPITPDNYPSDPCDGFLPPNDDTGRGEGHLRFRVRVKEDAIANSRINASATIVFDYNAPIETDPAWWNTVGVPGAQFAVSNVEADEGGFAEIRVSGGSADAASSVKLYISYNTAAAADLDLAKGAIDGVTPKGGLKFPLQLSWEAGDVGERVVTIPVKADKAVEDDEFFTLQLAAPVGMELGDATICTVTIHDPGYYDLEAKITSGTATKAEQTAWDKLLKAKAPYVLGLADPADAGKVAGSGLCAEGKKVTLKATANKGFVFMDWCDAAGTQIATTATLVVDRTAKPAASTATTTTLTGVNEDATYYAKFITVDEDRASITLALGSEELDASTVLETNVTCGVALEWPLASYALSATTVKVTGLPAGLKFAAKSNTIYGAPTAASKVGKDGKPTPSDVKITVTTAGKSSVTYLVKLTVDPLPAWAVGTFDGEVESGGIVQAFTVATSGKISGKVLEGGRTWTLSAGQFNHVEHVEQVGGSDVFYAAVVGKAGKEVVTNSVVVAAEDGMGVAEADVPRNWIAWQNLWKRADTNAAQPVFKKNIVVEYHFGAEGDKNNTVKITFKKDGAVSFAGKISGFAVSGSSQLVLADNGKWYATLYAPPKGQFPGMCITISVVLVVDEQNIVIDVDLDP